MSNNKRLERDLRTKVLGGVCSGLGNYFDMDPTFWRILFFILFFAGCSGLLIYIILWIVMPVGESQPGVNNDPQNIIIDPNGEPAKSKGQLMGGLIMIAIGGLWLTARYIPQINWHTAWPVILIVLGIFLIIPKKEKKS